MKKDWSQMRWIAVLPLVLIALLYVMEGSMRSSFFLCAGGICSESIPANIWKVIQVDETRPAPACTIFQTNTSVPAPSSNDPKISALRYNGRMAWLTLVEIYLLVCAAAIITAAALSYRLIPRRPWLWTGAILLASSCIGIGLFANPAAHMRVFMVFFEKTITPDFPCIQQTTNLLNSLGNGATFALLLTICLVLLPAQVEPYPTGLKQIAQKMKVLRAILFAGTALLVTMMLLKSAVFHWALGYTSQDKGMLEVAQSLVTGFMSMDGTFYSLLLCAAYLPASFILKRRARLLSKLPDEEAEVEKKFQEYGMTFASVKSIPRMLAIFAPFMLGPLGDLINNLFF